MPAYIVFTDNTLIAIAELLPADEAALIAIPGIGARKLEQYGPDVLELVAARLARHNRRSENRLSRHAGTVYPRNAFCLRMPHERRGPDDHRERIRRTSRCRGSPMPPAAPAAARKHRVAAATERPWIGALPT